MKNLKIGALVLAVLAVFGFVLNTNAQNAESEVKITITAGTNSCTLDEYDFSNTGVSATDVDLWELTNLLECELYASTAWTVQMQQADLDWTSDPANVIPATNYITVETETFVNTGTLTYTTAFTANNQWASVSDIYTVSANQVGVTSTDVTVGLIVPGGTAADDYAGDLVISVF